MERVLQLHTSSLEAEKHALKDAGVVGARWSSFAMGVDRTRISCGGWWNRGTECDFP
jgi:hypothetical protein